MGRNGNLVEHLDSSARKVRSDKGKPRPHYNNDLRRARAVDRGDTREPAVVPPGQPRHIRRQQARRKALPSDLKCPQCGKVKSKSRQWVVIKKKAICLACHRKNSKNGR